MTSYLIRAATTRDRHAVAGLDRRIRRELRLAPERGSEPGTKGLVDRTWVVEAGRREIVGYCGLVERSGGEFVVRSLYLVPEWRGFGVGRVLLATAAKYARDAGALRVALPVEGSDVEALAASLGFRRATGASGAAAFVLEISAAS